MSNNIYVGNLPWSFKDDTLRELFEEHGEVSDAKVIVDRMSGRSRGFVFVEMVTQNVQGRLDPGFPASLGQNTANCSGNDPHKQENPRLRFCRFSDARSCVSRHM